MSAKDALQKVIDDLNKQVNETNDELDYYQRRLKTLNEKVIALKETLAELEAMKQVFA